MANAAPSAPQVLAPAQLFMRWIAEFLGNFPFTLGGPTIQVPLRKRGYLDMLIVHVKGAFTGANASLVFNQLQPWNIITQFLVQPPGQETPIRLGGQTLHGWNLLSKDFAPFINGGDATAAGTLDANAFDASIMDVFPVAVGAQVVHLWYVLPFHRSSMDIRGVVPLGNDVQVNLIMQPSTKAGLVTVAANLTLDTWSVDVYQAYYTPPPAESGAVVDDQWAVTYDETFQPIVQVGAQTPVDIVPNNTILGILHAICLNNVMDSADVQALALQVNNSWFSDPGGLPGDAFTFIARRRYGRAFPVGLFPYDFDYSVDDGVLDSKAWIHTQQVQEIKSYIWIAAGATLGTNPNIYTSVRRLADLNPAGHLPYAG